MTTSTPTPPDDVRWARLAAPRPGWPGWRPRRPCSPTFNALPVLPGRRLSRPSWWTACSPPDAVLEVINFPPGTMQDLRSTGHAEIRPLYETTPSPRPPSKAATTPPTSPSTWRRPRERAELSAYFLTAGGRRRLAAGRSVPGRGRARRRRRRWRFRRYRIISGWGWRVSPDALPPITEPVPAERAWRGAPARPLRGALSRGGSYGLPVRPAQLALEHLPAADSGSGSARKLDRLGHLVAGDASRACVDQLVLGRPRRPARRTTTACTASPHTSWGTPMTATCATAGWVERAFSTSVEYTFSPPVTIMSLTRSTRNR